jgi:hypothetical protein
MKGISSPRRGPRGGGTAPRFAAPDVLGDDARGGLGACFRGDMGCHGDLRMRPEGMLCRKGFGPENVKRGMRELPAVERGKERVVVDERPAPGVHDNRALGQERQGARIQGVFRRRSVGQQEHDDRGLSKGGVEALGPVCGLDPVDGLGRARPAQHVEVQRRKRLCAGRPQHAESQHRHRTVPRQRRGGARAPHPVLPMQIGVHAEVMAQDMAGDPFHHALGQPVVDHARQRHRERGIACHVLHPRPEVQDRFQPCEGREIRQAAVRGIDDVVDIGRVGFGRQIGVPEAAGLKGGAERRFVLRPALGLCGEKDDGGSVGHGLSRGQLRGPR